MVFAFATKAMKMMLPMTFGLTSTLMMFIMSDGVQQMPNHLFLQRVSVIIFISCGANRVTTTTVLWPLDCVRDYLGEPVPER